jgi:hypothetical protein
MVSITACEFVPEALREPSGLNVTVRPYCVAEVVPGGGHEYPARSMVGNPSVIRTTYCWDLQPFEEGILLC